MHALLMHNWYCWYCKWTTSTGWQERSPRNHACVAGPWQ